MKYALPERDILKGEDGQMESVLGAYQSKWASEYENQNVQIDRVFLDIPFYHNCDEAKKNKIRRDMIFCFFAYGFTPMEYFVFRLENKSCKERAEFISSRLRMLYRCKMNNILQVDLFNDKAKTYKLYKEYYHREAISINQKSDFSLFEDFVKKHPVFVKKAVFEAQGNSVALIDINTCGMTKKELFDSLIKIGKHILEEKIVQTKDMSIFNETSVNTVRAITFNTKHGIQVPYCTIRTGRPGAFVDNGGAGGIQACVDFMTGKIISEGFDELGGEYSTHPASGTIFKGYQLPAWTELQKLICIAARKVPQIKFIGWDLAFTKDGWTLVEGNENCYIIAQQMIMNKGMRTTFEELMSDMELIV